MEFQDEGTEFRKIVVRLETVEKENRRLKRIVASAALLVSAALLMGQASPPRVIEAEKFVLKDESGRPRARIDMESGRPSLALLDGNGFPVVALHAGKNPSLTMCGESPTPTSGPIASCDQQVQIGRFSKEQFGIAFYGKDEGDPLHGLHAGFGIREGVPALDLWGKDANEHASLDLNVPGPSLLLSDSQGFTAVIGLERPRIGANTADPKPKNWHSGD